MYLKDTDLCMLEHLVYMDDKVALAAGVSSFAGIAPRHTGKTVEKILACFGANSLERLDNITAEIKGACTSGREWAGIIGYLKSSELRLLKLVRILRNERGVPLALCLIDEADADRGIVVLKGTSGGDEWIDNVEGFNSSDTDCQIQSLEFIDGLKYDKITVTGHSKGANKAMYATILSSKIDRCVVFDGQGFSREFIDKYWMEITDRGHNITNYSICTDYVHALMVPVPNSNQIYCKGFGIDNVKQHHSPNTFFVTDEDCRLVLDEAGKPQVVIVQEDESINILHGFTTFVMDYAEEEDKVTIVNFVSRILAKAFGEKNAEKDIIKFVVSQPDEFAIIIAYLVKYMEVNRLDAKDIDVLLHTLGLSCINKIITITSIHIPNHDFDIKLNLSVILNYIKKQLTDKDSDLILKTFILPCLKKAFFDKYNINVGRFWGTIDNKVRSIKTETDEKPKKKCFLSKLCNKFLSLFKRKK
ncbi:MAG: DUF2974 domain-containing protein [Lachnospiraceae bacterium]|nr:DUF2974 domain-containing protein [Lachnospiraceae bacterium]